EEVKEKQKGSEKEGKKSGEKDQKGKERTSAQPQRQRPPPPATTVTLPIPIAYKSMKDVPNEIKLDGQSAIARGAGGAQIQEIKKPSISIYVDDNNNVIFLPIGGQAVPFHCSFIKS
ncbi:MAG: hypothetical protein EZS28_053486, partial [Streblomastix strix]